MRETPGQKSGRRHVSGLIRLVTNGCTEQGHAIWSSEEEDDTPEKLGANTLTCGKDISFTLGTQRYVICKRHSQELGVIW